MRTYRRGHRNETKRHIPNPLALTGYAKAEQVAFYQYYPTSGGHGKSFIMNRWPWLKYITLPKLFTPEDCSIAWVYSI